MSTTALRRDARDNREKLKAAATDVFLDRGLGVPLDEIAHRAGVSTGTLYNRFGSREALIDAVISDLVGARLDAAISSADAAGDPWERLSTYLWELCALQAACPAASDVIALRYPDAVELAALCERARHRADAFVGEARDAGAVRADLRIDDVVVALTANAAVIASTHAAPDAWRRHLGFVLTGMRVPDAVDAPNER